MGRGSSLSRLQRLDQLSGLLRGSDHATVGDLAAALNVSTRTLSRDILLLRENGLPIDSDRGRGGGLQLHRSWSLGKLQLDPEEAISLLIGLTIADKIGAPLLLRNLPSIKRKITAVFADRHQGRIRSLRDRILIGGPASLSVLSTYVSPSPQVVAASADTFFNMRCLRIRYRDRDAEETVREIEPHFLYLNAPVWYLLSWDLLREDIRFFRIDRIGTAEPLQRAFRLRNRSSFLEQAERGAHPL